LKPLQENYRAITDEEIIDLLEENKGKVWAIAEQKIQEVYRKIWFSLF
jgi:hypothetical protein